MSEVKPGHKTTEFWVTMVMSVIGSGLIAQGYVEIGGLLLAIAGGSYTTSRGLAK